MSEGNPSANERQTNTVSASVERAVLSRQLGDLEKFMEKICVAQEKERDKAGDAGKRQAVTENEMSACNTRLDKHDDRIRVIEQNDVKRGVLSGGVTGTVGGSGISIIAYVIYKLFGSG